MYTARHVQSRQSAMVHVLLIPSLPLGWMIVVSSHCFKALKRFSCKIYCRLAFLFVMCFAPLSTILKIYHGVSCVTYQCYWFIHPDTNAESEPNNPTLQGGKAFTSIFKMFGMAPPGIEPSTCRIRNGDISKLNCFQIVYIACTLKVVCIRDTVQWTIIG